MTEQPKIQTVIYRADIQWCTKYSEDQLLPGQLDAITNAVDSHIVDPLRHEIANVTTMLGKLVNAITWSWDPGGNVGKQVKDALRQLKEVHSYLETMKEKTDHG